MGGVDLRSFRDVGLVEVGAVPVWRCYDNPDRQIVLLCEDEVALVVGGNAHDDASAVAQEHVVGDQDGDALTVELVGGVGAGEDAGLLLVSGEAFYFGLEARLPDIFLNFGAMLVSGQMRDQGVFGGEHYERDPVHGVYPGGEGAD